MKVPFEAAFLLEAAVVLKGHRPCSHWKIWIIGRGGGGAKGAQFHGLALLLVVGARSDWTEVTLFPPVLPELAAWEHCSHCKNHVHIKLGIKRICGVANGRRWQLFTFLAAYWSVTILSRRPQSFNSTLFEFWRPLSSLLAPLRLIPHNNPFTLLFIRHKVKFESLIRLFQPE